MAFLTLSLWVLEHDHKLSHSHCLPNPLQFNTLSLPALHKTSWKNMSLNTSRNNNRMTVFNNNRIHERRQFRLVPQRLQPYIFLSTSLCSTCTEHYIHLWTLCFMLFPLRILTETIHGPATFLRTYLTFSPWTKFIRQWPIILPVSKVFKLFITKMEIK
jgi:hypothetical protein